MQHHPSVSSLHVLIRGQAFDYLDAAALECVQILVSDLVRSVDKEL